jgi:heme a synthase
MRKADKQISSGPVAIWLLTGVVMIMIQVLLGGITRLTGSGLSITEWQPIIGALPPMNEQEWNLAFDKYKEIAQYKYLNFYFSLEDFKFIFFWEWLHRLWARLIGVVFLVPFIVFLFQKRFRNEMVKPLIILFLLGALQGLIGWIMVQSGLEDSEALYVSHFRLAIHFMLAMLLLCYVFWFALDLLVPGNQFTINKSLRVFTIWLIAVLLLQLIYGAFMAGLKAAAAAPTWPLINGSWWPQSIYSFGGRVFHWPAFLTDNPLVVHFIHRNLAYLLIILFLAWSWKAMKTRGTILFNSTKWLPLIVILFQTILGILTVLNAADIRMMLWLGVAHQFTAMLLLLLLTWFVYIVRPKTNSIAF